MFDAKAVMEGRKLLDPIPTPVPAEFPHTDEVPEGCTVLKGLKDEWGYYVDIHQDVIYAERDGRQLRMHILEPRVHFGAPETEEKAAHKWPCIAYIQGSAVHTKSRPSAARARYRVATQANPNCVAALDNNGLI